MNYNVITRVIIVTLCFIGQTSRGEPLQRSIDAGDGIEIQIIGSDSDGISIVRNGRQIFSKMLRDGAIMVQPKKASDDGNHYNIALRYGHDADLFMTLAIIDEHVIQSPPYRNTAKVDPYDPRDPNRNIPGHWIGPNSFRIEGGQPAVLYFNQNTTKWEIRR